LTILPFPRREGNLTLSVPGYSGEKTAKKKCRGFWVNRELSGKKRGKMRVCFARRAKLGRGQEVKKTWVKMGKGTRTHIVGRPEQQNARKKGDGCTQGESKDGSGETPAWARPRPSRPSATQSFAGDTRKEDKASMNRIRGDATKYILRSRTSSTRAASERRVS